MTLVDGISSNNNNNSKDNLPKLMVKEKITAIGAISSLTLKEVAMRSEKVKGKKLGELTM